MIARETGRRIAARYRSRFLRSYVAIKVAADPVYEAVYARLAASPLPLLDLGCGAGVLPLYLRERGYRGEIVGVDYDERKISAARLACLDGSIRFECGDIRKGFDVRGNVALLDLLHYLSDEDQQLLLAHAAGSVAEGGMVLIRESPRDASWRYRATYAEESFATAIHWLKAARLNFPTREAILRPFIEQRFAIEVTPMWGRTPFNNHLFVLTKSQVTS